MAAENAGSLQPARWSRWSAGSHVAAFNEREDETMKTTRTVWLTALALVAAGCWLGVPAEARAQQGAYYVTTTPQTTLYYPSDQGAYQLYYYRVYQGPAWYWSPTFGWYTQDRYVYVPYWAPAYTYSQPFSAPTITSHYALY
jgi:hypothetical protein